MNEQAPLRGVALMQDGAKRMGIGIVETVYSEVQHGMKLGVLGAVVGGVVGAFTEKGPIRGALDTGKALAQFGIFWGWETAHMEPNAVANQGERGVRWYDWVAANLIALNQEARKVSTNRAVVNEATIIQQLLPPMTVSAAKDVIRGAFQAVLG